MLFVLGDIHAFPITAKSLGQSTLQSRASGGKNIPGGKASAVDSSESQRTLRNRPKNSPVTKSSTDSESSASNSDSSYHVQGSDGASDGSGPKHPSPDKSCGAYSIMSPNSDSLLYDHANKIYYVYIKFGDGAVTRYMVYQTHNPTIQYMHHEYKNDGTGKTMENELFGPSSTNNDRSDDLQALKGKQATGKVVGWLKTKDGTPAAKTTEAIHVLNAHGNNLEWYRINLGENPEMALTNQKNLKGLMEQFAQNDMSSDKARPEFVEKFRAAIKGYMPSKTPPSTDPQTQPQTVGNSSPPPSPQKPPSQVAKPSGATGEKSDKAPVSVSKTGTKNAHGKR